MHVSKLQSRYMHYLFVHMCVEYINLIECTPFLFRREIFRHAREVWIDRTIEGTSETTAAGLLDECVLDDDEGKCGRFESALAKLDSLLGVSAGEQY